MCGMNLFPSEEIYIFLLQLYGLLLCNKTPECKKIKVKHIFRAVLMFSHH